MSAIKKMHKDPPRQLFLTKRGGGEYERLVLVQKAIKSGEKRVVVKALLASGFVHEKNGGYKHPKLGKFDTWRNAFKRLCSNDKRLFPHMKGMLREKMICIALDTTEGRKLLAEAMIEPIKTSLLYQAVGRKLLMVDELPQNAIPKYERDVPVTDYVYSGPRYEKDITVKPHVIGNRWKAPTTEVGEEELFVPNIEIASNPTVRLDDIKSQRFYVVDRAQQRAKESLQRQHDAWIFDELNGINHALSEIERHELIGARIIIPESRYKDIQKWGKKFALPKKEKRRARNGRKVK